MASKRECRQRYWTEEKLDRAFTVALGKFYLNDKVRVWARRALLQSHEEEEEFVHGELARLRAEQTRCETKLHTLYDDKLAGTIDQEYFESAFKKTRERQQEIRAEIERLETKNINYIEEGLRILELMQNIKNVYVKSNLENKAKILKTLSSNCTLKGVRSVSVTFHWNRPFDMLFKLGQSEDRGGLIHELRTFLSHISLSRLIQQLSQLAV